MSAPCLNKITNPVTWASTTLLDNDVLNTFVFAKTSCKIFKIELAQFTVIDFSYTLTSLGDFSGAISFYRVVGSDVTEIASTIISDIFGNFSKEFSAGTYAICIESIIFQQSTMQILAHYRGYQKQTIFSITFSTGENLKGNIPTIRPPSPCTRPLFFRIVDGALPPGFRMTSLGRVLGVAPELDCMIDNADLPPSQNWSFSNFDGQSTCWGRQWRFKVEVSIQGMPDVVAEEWFCVRIHNDWSKDRDAFLAQAPFTTDIDLAPRFDFPSIADLCTTQQADEVRRDFVLPCIPPKEIEWKPSVVVGPCEECNTITTISSVLTIPAGVETTESIRFREWLALLDSKRSVSKELNDFVNSVYDNPLVKEFLDRKPVKVTTAPTSITLELPTNDPLSLYNKWRLQETQRLPLYVEAQDGCSMEAELTISPR